MTSWTEHVERCVRLACRLEVTARKPGNIHPGASFDGMTWGDFVRSGEIVAPHLARAESIGVGAAVLDSILATREEVRRNTNLGIVLLVAPLAAVPRERTLAEGIGDVLSGLTDRDASLVYRAIRCARPGGMGVEAEGDVRGEPTGSLVAMMRVAAHRDLIAAQYAGGFETVLEFGLPFLAGRSDWERRWEEYVVRLHLELMARHPDSLIGRKRGEAEARESSHRAAAVLESEPGSAEWTVRLRELDAWLRAEGHARNPGTTADLVTACLFAALRERAMPVIESFSS